MVNVLSDTGSVTKGEGAECAMRLDRVIADNHAWYVVVKTGADRFQPVGRQQKSELWIDIGTPIHETFSREGLPHLLEP